VDCRVTIDGEMKREILVSDSNQTLVVGSIAINFIVLC
jgi:hypothetical protein